MPTAETNARNGSLHAQLKKDLSASQFKEELLDAVMYHTPNMPQTDQGEGTESDPPGSHGQVSSSLNETCDDAHGAQDKTPQTRDDTPGARDKTPQTRDDVPGVQDATLQSEGRISGEASSPPNPISNASLETLFGERRKRLEAEKAAEDKAEKERLKGIAKAKRKKAEAVRVGAPQSSQASWAQTQLERKRAAHSERERILKAIENDRVERREKHQRRKEATTTFDVEEPAGEPRTLSKSDRCALKVRLPDGSTFSKGCSPNETIHDVRSWIDQSSGGDNPYNLKHLLTPLPNRQITVAEEGLTLKSLGMTPSAILVVVPVRDFATTTRPSGHVAKAVALCNSLFWYLVGVMMYLQGIRGRPSPRTPEKDREEAKEADLKGETKAMNPRNPRTLHERRTRGEDQQLYNGNQLNFEARDGENSD